MSAKNPAVYIFYHFVKAENALAFTFCWLTRKNHNYYLLDQKLRKTRPLFNHLTLLCTKKFV